MTKVGLRIDVDTFRGTREGGPRLLEILSKHNIQSNIFQRRPERYGLPSLATDETTVLWKMPRRNISDGNIISVTNKL